MDEKELDLETLDQVQYLLERMLELAEHSASDSQRHNLQKGFELLQSLLDEATDRYQKGRATE